MPEEFNPVHRAASALDRRQLLRVVGTSAGALLFAKVLTGCQANPTGSPPTGPVSGGNVSSLKLDSLQVLSSNVVIGAPFSLVQWTRCSAARRCLRAVIFA